MGTSKQEFLFGKIAVKEGFLSKGDLKECIQRQEELAEEGGSVPPIQEIMLEAGYVTDEEIREIEETREEITQQHKIPGYEIHEKLGEGATGAVYKATQLSLDRPVAIKVLYPSVIEDESYLERFYREARTVAKLNHESIIQGIDVGEEDGLYYFVMEYVEGESLDDILEREGRISEEQALDIGLQAARALKHAGEYGLIHRDIKPENIMIDREGIAKLCDLGLAKKTGNEDSSVTQMGVTIGTPHYMSPEQAKGENLDIRTDIYALGASLYHAVTGEVPFDADAATSVLTKQVTEDLVPPEEKNANLSPRFNAVIEKMMSKDPDDRYQDAEELIEDLERIKSGKDPKYAQVDGEQGQVREQARSADPWETVVGRDKLSTGKLVTAAGAVFLGLLVIFSFDPFSADQSNGTGSQAKKEKQVISPPQDDRNNKNEKDRTSNKKEKEQPESNDQADRKGQDAQADEEQKNEKEETEDQTQRRRELFRDLKTSINEFDGDLDRVSELESQLSSLLEKTQDHELLEEIRTVRSEFLQTQAERYYEENISQEVTEDSSISQVQKTYRKLIQFPELYKSTEVWNQVQQQKEKAQNRISIYLSELKRQLREKVKTKSFEEAEKIYQKLETLGSREHMSALLDWKEVRIRYLRKRSRDERNKLEEAKRHLREFKRKFRQHYRLSSRCIIQVSDKQVTELIDWYTEQASLESVRKEIERYREDVKMLSFYRDQLRQKLTERIERDGGSGIPLEIGDRKGKLVGMNDHVLLIELNDSQIKEPLGQLAIQKRIAFANWNNEKLEAQEKFTFGLASYLANHIEDAKKWLRKASDSGIDRAGYYLDELRLRQMSPREQKAQDLVESLQRARSEGLEFAIGRIVFDLKFYQDTSTFQENKSLIAKIREELPFDPDTYLKGTSNEELKKRVQKMISAFEKWYNADVGRGAGIGSIYLSYDFANKEQLTDWTVSNSQRLSISHNRKESQVDFSGEGFWLHNVQFSEQARLEARVSMQKNISNIGGLIMWRNNQGYRGMYNWNPLGRSSEFPEVSSNVLQYMKLPSGTDNPDYTSTRIEIISRAGQKSFTGNELSRFGIHRERNKLRLTLNGRHLVSTEDDRSKRGRSGLVFENEQGSVLEVTISGKPDREWFEKVVDERGISEAASAQGEGVSGNLKMNNVSPGNIAHAVNVGGESVDVDGISFRKDPFEGEDVESYIGDRSQYELDSSSPYSKIYATQRFGPDLRYAIPVASGTYEVTLFFIENYWSKAGERLIDVSIEGKTVVTELDLFKKSGGLKKGLKMKFQNVQVSDQNLDLRLAGSERSQDPNASITGFLIRRSGKNGGGSSSN